MNVYDMLELSSEFIFQVSHHTRVSSAKKPLEKELLEHYQHMGHTLVLPEFDSSMFYWIEFSAISAPSFKKCSKLSDNKCSIYSKRPTPCKLQPLEYNLPENQQYKKIEFYKQQTEKKIWNCDFSEKSPQLVYDNNISNMHQNSLYYHHLQQIRDFTDKYIDSMAQYHTRQEDHLKTVVKAHMSKSVLVTDIIQPLFVLLNHNIIEPDLAYEIINNQISIINSDIKRATDLRIKEDVKYSRLYKKILESYSRAIKNRIFDSQENLQE